MYFCKILRLFGNLFQFLGILDWNILTIQSIQPFIAYKTSSSNDLIFGNSFF